MWLTSFDPNGGWPPTEVTLLRRVQIGDRTDHAWARLSPPVPLSPHSWSETDHVILGARHQGFDVWSPTTWPMHVFISTVSPELADRSVFDSADATIARWGLLHETFERAETDEF
jgi:hypothetical protein